MKKRIGFTLSEVLITLGVIGVVAAMTLPTLIKNYQKTVTVTRLKATYSTISQAVKMSEVDNGAITTWKFPNPDSSYSIKKLYTDTYFKPYFKNIKECKKLSDCVSENYYRMNGELDSETIDKPTLMLNNGVVLAFNFDSESNMCIVITDINGKRGPNTAGKDKFWIVLDLVTGYIQFDGQQNNLYQIKKDCKLLGYYCGAWIFMNGWKIPDDYPW